MNDKSHIPPPVPSVQSARLGVAWLLWVLLTAIAWLLPGKFPPWMTFDNELTMVAALLTLAAGLLVTGSPLGWRAPPAALLALALAVVPLLQWFAGLVTYFGDAALASLYLIGFGGAVLCGVESWRRFGAVWLDALFGAVALAALLSTAIALYQAMGLSALGMAVTKLPGSRPFGNLGQPNQLATLLGWGLMVMWWFWLRGHLRGWMAAALSAFLLLGVAMTQSRTAWAYMLMLAIGAVLLPLPLRSRRAAPVLAVLAVLFCILVASWQSIAARSFEFVAEPMVSRLQPGTRWGNWQVLIDGISRQPWFGFGWQQVHAAQQAALLDHPKTLEAVDHSHNLVLDLLIWNGVPLGGLIVILGAAWWWRAGRLARQLAEPAGAVVFLALTVSLVHSMLEYPHSYALFLFPAGLMVGTLCSIQAAAPSLLQPTQVRWFLSDARLPRWVLWGLLGFGIAAAAVVNHDYRAARARLEMTRLEILNISSPYTTVPGEAPVNHSLTQLRDFLNPPKAVMGQPPEAEGLERLRRFALRYPQQDSMMQYAMAQAQVGDISGAGLTMRRMCHLMADDRCGQMRELWGAMARGNWPELASVRF